MSTYMKKNAGRARARRQFLIIIAAFFAAVCLFLLGGSWMRSSQVKASSNQQVYYKSVRVSAGDTLWDLADDYMGTAFENKNEYIDQVKKINHITEKDLQAGSSIIVPCSDIMD